MMFAEAVVVVALRLWCAIIKASAVCLIVCKVSVQRALVLCVSVACSSLP